MDRKEDFEKLYDMMLEYEEEIHKKNQKRIKIGMKCLLIIPMIFLILLLLTQSSKLVFLILWIVSLFILAAYLIFVEYSDDKLQQKLSEISNREQAERDALIGSGIAQVEERIRTVIKDKELEVFKEQAKERQELSDDAKSGSEEAAEKEETEAEVQQEVDKA